MLRLPFVFAVCALSILPLVTPRVHAPVTAQSPQAAGDDTARINAWFETKFKEQLAFSPIQQTFLGQKTGELDDMSIAAQDRQLAWRRAATAEMRKSFDYAKLSPEAQTSYDVWIYQLEQAEAAVPLPDQRLRVRSDVGHPLLPSAAAHRLPPGRRCVGHGGVRQSHSRVGPGAPAADRDLEEERDHGRSAAALRLRLRHRRIDQDHHRRAVHRQRHRQRGVGRRQGEDRRAAEEGRAERRARQGDAGRGAGRADRSVQGGLRHR